MLIQLFLVLHPDLLIVGSLYHLGFVMPLCRCIFIIHTITIVCIIAFIKCGIVMCYILIVRVKFHSTSALNHFFFPSRRIFHPDTASWWMVS